MQKTAAIAHENPPSESLAAVLRERGDALVTPSVRLPRAGGNTHGELELPWPAKHPFPPSSSMLPSPHYHGSNGKSFGYLLLPLSVCRVTITSASYGPLHDSEGPRCSRERALLCREHPLVRRLGECILSRSTCIYHLLTIGWW